MFYDLAISFDILSAPPAPLREKHVRKVSIAHRSLLLTLADAGSAGVFKMKSTFKSSLRALRLCERKKRFQRYRTLHTGNSPQMNANKRPYFLKNYTVGRIHKLADNLTTALITNNFGAYFRIVLQGPVFYFLFGVANIFIIG